MTFVNQAINEAENTEQFYRVVDLLKDYPLFKGEHVRAVNIAANAFIKHTGTYQAIWNNKDVNEDSLIDLIEDSMKKEDYEIVRLFVFDGFELYDTMNNSNLLKEIVLPFGKIQILKQAEIEALFKIPKSDWPSKLNIDYLSKLHVLIIKGKEQYRKPTAEDLGEIYLPASSPLFEEWRERIKREADIDYIGPLFLCLGEDANLAQEIIIRTCIFDKRPISTLNRNDYLLDPIYLGDEVELFPRMSPVYIGQNGIMLVKLYEMWNEVNHFKGKDYLRFSTEAYVRAIMNWHYHPDSTMELFVSFITVIDSLLTRDGMGDLAYKIAARGAAILSPDSQKRIDIMSYLKKLYNIRSKIVHQGDTKGEDLIDFLVDLPNIVRHIFIKFIIIVYLFKKGLFDDTIMKYVNKPNDKNQSIGDILDLCVMQPKLTTIIDAKLSEMNIELGILSILR